MAYQPPQTTPPDLTVAQQHVAEAIQTHVQAHEASGTLGHLLQTLAAQINTLETKIRQLEQEAQRRAGL